MIRRGIAPLVLGWVAALILGACTNPATTGIGADPLASLTGVAAYAAHVDATFDTITAIFQDAEGSSLEQYAADSRFAVYAQTWIAAQPPIPCLAAAAAQWTSAIATLKADMDASVEDFRSGNAAAIASSNAQFDPARPQLLLAKDAVDQAAARC
jgi:hypothetical protein